MKHTHTIELPPDEETSSHNRVTIGEMDTQRLLSGIMANLADSMNGLTLRGARAVPLGTASQGTMRPLGGGAAGRLVGWSLRESSGAGSVLVRIYDGHDTNGVLLATIPLAAAAEAVSAASTSTQNLPAGGVSITDGLYVAVGDPLIPGNAAAGTVEGSLWIGAAE